MQKRFAALATGFVLFFSTPVLALPEGATAPSPVPAQTWEYLESISPGEQSILAYSLGGRQVRADARTALMVTLEDASKANIFAPEQLAKSIISLVKLEENPKNYKGTNLLALLSSHENIYVNGLEGAAFTLDAYSAAGDSSVTSRNSTASVIDYVVSSQQRSGGFASLAGKEPNVMTTAQIAVALAPNASIPYVHDAIDKAVSWLAGQQNPDGTFSAAGQPSCEATAAVYTALTACGVSPDDPRFLKEGRDLRDALQAFRNSDGGYAAVPGAESTAEATEAAVIALYTAQTGLSPYLPPSFYPGYVVQQPSTDVVFRKFIVGFFIVFGALYLALILTTKIGKKWGKFPQPATEPQDKAIPAPEERTMELHIPMKAQMPNFDEIASEEFFHGPPPADESAPQKNCDGH